LTQPDKPSAREQTRQAAGLLRDASGPDLHHLGWAVLWLTFAAGMEVLGPLLGKRLIDEHLLPKHLDWVRMALLLGGVLVTGWIATWVRYRQLLRLSGVAMRSVQRLRERVYSHVLRLPMAFFDRAITGQLVSRVTNDTEAVKGLYIQVLFVILDSSIVLVGTVAAMAWLDWRLMTLVVALLPFVLVIVWAYQRLSAPAVTRARQLRSDINAQIAESIGGMTVLQANNAEQRFGQRFAATNAEHYTQRLAEIRANAWLLRPALDMLNILLLASVIFMFGQRDMSAAEVGVLYAFINYIARVIEPLIQITMQFSQLQQSVASRARRNTGKAALRMRATPPTTKGWRQSRSATWTLNTSRASACCTSCRCRSRKAPSSASSGTPAAASRRCCRCCCATTPPRTAASA
jgi:ATP-binding cassette subfamily B protein/ATP-binding cassette subfamily C protein/ATP-binding cassette subfamily B multidrug efflux pump